MLRKLVLVGLFAGASASVPVLYQANPEFFEGAVKAALEEPAPAPEPQRPLVVIQKAKVEAPRDTGRKVRLEADPQGHYNGEFRLNGRAVEALVDTGATVIALNTSTARRLGISIASLDFSQRISTANGVSRGALAQLDSVQIGRIQVRDVQAIVLDDKALSGTLVGMSFLGRLASFRVESGVLVMEQ